MAGKIGLQSGGKKGLQGPSEKGQERPLGKLQKILDGLSDKEKNDLLHILIKEKDAKGKKEKDAKEKKEKEERCQKLIERGQNFINEHKLEEWKEYVKSSVNGPYDGRDVSNVLELLEIIEIGASREKIQEIFDDQGHSSGSYNSVRSRVVQFSKKGEEADKNLDK